MQYEKKFLIIANRCRGMGANRLFGSICKELGHKSNYIVLKPQDGIFFNFLKYVMFYLNSDRNNRVVWCLNDLPIYPLKIDYFLFHNTLLISKHTSGLATVKRYILFTLLKVKRLTVVCQTSLTAKRFEESFSQLDLNIEIRMHPLPIKTESSKTNNKFINVLSKQDSYVLYPVANYPHKNISFLLQNLQIFRDEKMCLVLCIDPIKEFEDDDCVIFLGAVSSQSMPYLYQSVDAVINVSDTESVGLFLVEAVIFNKPLVSVCEEYVYSIISSFYEINKLTSVDLHKALKRAKDDHFAMVPHATLQLSATWKDFLNAHF